MGLANKNVLLIDNEDSFTYNLIQLIEQNNYNVDIISGKDKYKPECNSYKYILFSPGPGIPNDFPLMKTILTKNTRYLPWTSSHSAAFWSEAVQTN